MTDEVKLHVGYVGRTRDGKRVEILGTGGPDGYSFKSDNGKTYNEFGMWSHKYPRSENDIIGPWTEPTTEYPVGQWIGWNGGECPVHPETEIKRSFPGAPITRHKAADTNWDMTFLFYIVTPYVEPKPPLECWVNVDENGWTLYDSLQEAKKNAVGFHNVTVRMVEADQ